MSLSSKQFVNRINTEIGVIEEYEEHIDFMSDEKRHELLKLVLVQYKELLRGNKKMLEKIRG